MVLPGPPIGLRTFPQNDEIALFAEVYDNAGSTPHKVDITATVTTDEGKVLFKADEVRDSSDLGGKTRRLRLRGADSFEGYPAGPLRLDRVGEVEDGQEPVGAAPAPDHRHVADGAGRTLGKRFAKATARPP